MTDKAYARAFGAVSLTEEDLITIFLKQNDVFSIFKKCGELKAVDKDLVLGKLSVQEAVHSTIVKESIELP